MKTHGDVDARVHIPMYTQDTATALGKCRMASPTLGRVYPRYSFYSRLSGPQEQSGY